ncbi:hypothetical protein O4444_03220 [Xylella fastidiosa subsp. pauca]|uniref:Uncharacterized protein n=1 Tax=Xylella fastidiosa (strain 9a5c) TaxID=160492 RepID=Q9PB22_XYLFA|nr:hypothetical protein [Xylella fastidiosa]AAF85122.1 hypothetical protein XF_2323 [Xylella fastidiosa 9a5c]MDG5823867.1 hypothetical protein [Xylella fastidiosa subsp. pauca]MDG5824862.1 hypothetical protein [Xylella fastidiosa subsp. pauca]WGZ32638.1 hypothetical protein O4444_03220 [Xylella fastidiosa subsp. pauca]
MNERHQYLYCPVNHAMAVLTLKKASSSLVFVSLGLGGFAMRENAKTSSEQCHR